MPEDITFLDLACLMKISNDTTLERFGSAINSSIFDASNIAGTLKQKDLIDFTSIFPGPNSIAVTANGKAAIAEAEQKSLGQFDSLDKSILDQISKGKSSPKDIQGAISLNPHDLAIRLYKLSRQNLLTYELKSGQVEILLTEQGFLKAAPQQIRQQSQQQVQQPYQPAQPIHQMQQANANSDAQTDAQQAQPPQKSRRNTVKTAALSIAVIIVIIILILYISKVMA